MKRDMDLIRHILMKIEANDDPLNVTSLITGENEGEMYYHLQLLLDANLIRSRTLGTFYKVKEPLQDFVRRGERKGVATDPRGLLTFELTWEGHEFLDAARDPSRWEQAKGIAGKAGIMTLTVLKDILVQLGAEAYKKMMFEG